MGFNPPVPQRDSDWEIRAAVLLSLLFQVLLVVVGPSRKRTSNPLPRFAAWSCYLLADWVGDLALGLLVNNLGNIGGNNASSSLGGQMKQRGGGGTTTTTAGSPGIFAFWTPFLLLHQGGPDTITAYSMEDNELWPRHLIGLLFQLFSACLVFACSLQANPVVPATALMFVTGVIKYGERVYSLYSASVDGVITTIIPAPNPGPNYARLMTVFSSKERAGLDVDIVHANGVASQSRKARDTEEVARQAHSLRRLEVEAFDMFTIFRSVCYDINLGHRARKVSQAFFLDRNDMDHDRCVEVAELELNFIYDMAHTKEPVAHTLAGCILRFVSSACIAASSVAFWRVDKRSIRHVDVYITYALLFGAVALDAVALAMVVFFSNWTLVYLDKSSPRLLKRSARLIRWVRGVRPMPRWSEMASQMNLVSYCLGHLEGDDASRTAVGRRLWKHRRAVRVLAKVAHKLRARELFDDLFFVRYEPLKIIGRENVLLAFIVDELKAVANQVRKSTVGDRDDAWRSTSSAANKYWRSTSAANQHRRARHQDVEEMRKACSYRGERALKSMQQNMMESMGYNEDSSSVNWYVLMDSVIDRDFDESLLMWHIATDLCHCSFRSVEGPETAATAQWKPITTMLSEYMLYLLLKQPKILAASAGVGQVAYQDTCAEARRFFESAAMWVTNHEDARRMLLAIDTSVPTELVKGGRSKSVLFDACIVAKELRKIDEEDLMWEVVARVWTEMLTYAAGKCKGTTHVKQLARGGELITMVWLLMAHMGIGNIYQKEVEDDATPKLIIRGQ